MQKSAILRIRYMLVVFAICVFGVERVWADDAKPAKKWTFLNFVNAKNNLESFGLEDVNEMEAFGSSEDVNVVAELGLQGRTTPDYKPSVKRYFVTKDEDKKTISSLELETLGKTDMGSWEHLAEFIIWGVRNFPAEHYFVNIWNHGSGWRIKSQMGARDISFDDETNNAIKTVELKLVFEKVFQETGAKIDVVGADACAMAMAEVAYELKDHSQYFVGSEELVPGPGWDYTGILSGWAQSVDQSPRVFSSIVAQSAIASYSGGSQGWDDAVMSVIDIAKLQDLVLALGDFSKAVLERATPNDIYLIKKAMKGSFAFGYGYFDDYRDLTTFFELLSKAGFAFDRLNVSQIVAIQDSIKNAVAANYVTSTFEGKAHGISYWLPTTKSYLANYGDRYATLSINQATQWKEALEKIFSE